MVGYTLSLFYERKGENGKRKTIRSTFNAHRSPLTVEDVQYVTIIQVVIVSGFHLFPFRTEKLSPSAPMVLHTRGRVGSRRFSDERVLWRMFQGTLFFDRAESQITDYRLQRTEYR